MTDTRDPRGIVSFFIRYLVLHAVFLLGFTLSYVIEIALIYFFGFIGFFTFLQVLIAIPRKFLDKAGSWKPVAIAGALLSDVAVLWWLGGIARGFSWTPTGSSWPYGCLSTSSLPSSRGDSARSSTRRILNELLRPASLTVPPIRLKPKTSAIPKTQRQTSRRPPPRSLRPKRAPTPTTSSSFFCSGLNYPAVGRAHTPAPASSMRIARTKRTQKTQPVRILPHRTPVRHFQKTTTGPLAAKQPKQQLTSA